MVGPLDFASKSLSSNLNRAFEIDISEQYLCFTTILDLLDPRLRLLSYLTCGSIVLCIGHWTLKARA